MQVLRIHFDTAAQHRVFCYEFKKAAPHLELISMSVGLHESNFTSWFFIKEALCR